VARARVQLTAKASAGPTRSNRAITGPDGRFQLEADPGDYQLWAQADDYRQAQSEVTVDLAPGECRYLP